MGAMAQVYTETQEQQDRIDALRRELRTAAARFEALAHQTQAGPLRELYSRWARETRQTVENV
jgi:hypothetical protein